MLWRGTILRFECRWFFLSGANHRNHWQKKELSLVIYNLSLRKLRQEDSCEFNGSLSYIMSSRQPGLQNETVSTSQSSKQTDRDSQLCLPLSDTPCVTRVCRHQKCPLSSLSCLVLLAPAWLRETLFSADLAFTRLSSCADFSLTKLFGLEWWRPCLPHLINICGTNGLFLLGQQVKEVSKLYRESAVRSWDLLWLCTQHEN